MKPPYQQLAKIGQSNQVSERARLQYEELFEEKIAEFEEMIKKKNISYVKKLCTKLKQWIFRGKK